MPAASTVTGRPRLTAGAIVLGCLLAAGVASPGPIGAADSRANVNPDRVNKACLARRLRTPPRVVLFGSSIFSKGDPAEVSAKTGLTAFNASVSHGNADDAWVLLNLIHDAHPATRQQVVWLLDPETFSGRGGPDPALFASPFTARFARPGYRDARGETAARQTARQARTAAFRACLVRTNSFTRYRADGYRSYDYHDRNLAAGETQAEAIKATVDEYRAIYRDRYRRLDTHLERRFDQTIRLADGWGVRPIVVLAPMHPSFVSALAPYGYAQRSDQVVAFLRGAARRESFTLLDARSLSVFAGTPADFFDGVHLQAPAVRRMLAWVLRRAPLPHA
ncbi:MAG: hypothetical protein QOE87_1582 [Gaiellales bacterium]|nr:hypothetical protein [Gaiellales bacterium]